MLKVHESWPDKNRPGFPLYPDQTRAHIVSHPEGYPIKGPWDVLWSAVEQNWVDHFGNVMSAREYDHLVYVGPCRNDADYVAKCLHLCEALTGFGNTFADEEDMRIWRDAVAELTKSIREDSRTPNTSRT